MRGRPPAASRAEVAKRRERRAARRRRRLSKRSALERHGQRRREGRASSAPQLRGLLTEELEEFGHEYLAGRENPDQHVRLARLFRGVHPIKEDERVVRLYESAKRRGRAG